MAHTVQTLLAVDQIVGTCLSPDALAKTTTETTRSIRGLRSQVDRCLAIRHEAGPPSAGYPAIHPAPLGAPRCRYRTVSNIGGFARYLLIWFAQRFGDFAISGEIHSSDQHAGGQSQDGGSQKACGQRRRDAL